MRMVRDTPNRAREWALHEFANIGLFGMPFFGEYKYPHQDKSHTFNYDGGPPDYQSSPPRVGDLVYLQAAPVSQQWLGILVDITPLLTKEGKQYDTLYGIRGVGCTEVANWTNVGICVVNRLYTADYPRYWWTEEHWAFEDKLMKAIRLSLRKEDPYAEYRSLTPDLLQDNGSITFRRKWSDVTDPRVTIQLPNWRKITLTRLKEAFNQVPQLFGETAK